jgi:predicted nucleic acid-binding protein
MVVMTEKGVTDVLTDDDHFLQVGLGFTKIP